MNNKATLQILEKAQKFLEKAPQTLPPRPGLQWNPISHRWVRPDNLGAGGGKQGRIGGRVRTPQGQSSASQTLSAFYRIGNEALGGRFVGRRLYNYGHVIRNEEDGTFTVVFGHTEAPDSEKKTFTGIHGHYLKLLFEYTS